MRAPIVSPVVDAVAQPAPADAAPEPAVFVSRVPVATHLVALDPSFFSIVSHDQGVERGSLTVPICPTPNVTDTVLFEDPKDSSKHYALPRYDLPNASPVPVLFQQEPDGWSLSVDLKKSYAAEVASAGAPDLEHQLDVTLQYALLIAGGGTVVAPPLHFNELTDIDGGKRAVLKSQDAGTRDQVYVALTNPALGATLHVARQVTVAIAIPDGGG